MFAPRFIHCPIEGATQWLGKIAELGLGVEIQFDTTGDLWPQVRWENLLDLADAIADHGLNASVHGPFNGLDLGSRDAHIREYSLDVLAASLEAARAFRSPHVVFHSGCLPQYSPTYRAQWLDTFTDGLARLIEKATDLEVRLALENTYETDPVLFEEIFARFPTPALGMCFDVGHAACFGRVDVPQWSERFAERIFHLHVHDNDGHYDLHQGLGTGVARLRPALQPLARFGGQISVTFEVPEADAVSSRDVFDREIQALILEETP
jgi:sugar phosphate isomerase/epimerase